MSAVASRRLSVLRRTIRPLPSPATASSVGSHGLLSRSLASAASANFQSILDKQLEDIRQAGTFKNERVITSSQSSSIYVRDRNVPVLNFCANNYLGLANNAEVIAASRHALETHGNGLASVRFICGTQDIHKQLEQAVAKFHGRDDAILFISCFDANAAIFETVLGEEDAVISDELNHASIIDGIRLCKAKRFRYKHSDMGDLEEKLKEADKSGVRVKLIATDGVFSMDGEIAPLPAICNLANKYNAVTFVDDCHATGFLGKTGRGTEEYYDMLGRVDIINSTLGKALGGAAGGYTVASKQVIQLLRQRGRPYLFSNTLPPAVVGGALKVFEMISANTKLRDQLFANTTRFRSRMTAAGFKLRGADHPIVPIMLGDARLASEFADEMLTKGIYVIGFSFPVVPKGLARIRVQLSAAHTLEQVDRCVDAFIEVGKRRGVIPN